MRHDWIFEVLMDLRTYAQANGLPALAEQAEHAMRVARAEIAALAIGDDTDDSGGHGAPPGGRPH
ncbi:MAG: hypothetical protein KF887_05795 [Paracoccaceae bacterium]|nr:MAG: hypothetical protein KF887_05795 [Paracoccaceae bacterium]